VACRANLTRRYAGAPVATAGILDTAAAGDNPQPRSNSGGSIDVVEVIERRIDCIGICGHEFILPEGCDNLAKPGVGCGLTIAVVGRRRLVGLVGSFSVKDEQSRKYLTSNARSANMHSSHTCSIQLP